MRVLQCTFLYWHLEGYYLLYSYLQRTLSRASPPFSSPLLQWLCSVTSKHSAFFFLNPKAVILLAEPRRLNPPHVTLDFLSSEDFSPQTSSRPDRFAGQVLQFIATLHSSNAAVRPRSLGIFSFVKERRVSLRVLQERISRKGPCCNW